MVQFVFVHGVSAPRTLDRYQAIVQKRRKLCKEFCFLDKSVAFHDPYWGEHGAPSQDSYKSIPSGNGDTALAIGATGGNSLIQSLQNDPELELNSQSLSLLAKDDYIGFLNDLALAVIDGGHEVDDENIKLANTIADHALFITDEESGEVNLPNWLENVNSDEQLISQLNTELSLFKQNRGIASLGVGNKLKNKAKKIFGNLASGSIIKKARKVTPKIAVFLGDAFLYLKDGDPRERIRSSISKAIVDAAIKADQNSEKLILCGHSMGANILLDLLWDEVWLSSISETLGKELSVDLFLSVGTQLGLFEELKLFKASQTNVVQDKPRGVKNWWHVYDEADILSFTANKVINGVNQFSVNTKSNVFEAHGAYFYSSIFYRRLRRRLLDKGII